MYADVQNTLSSNDSSRSAKRTDFLHKKVSGTTKKFTVTVYQNAVMFLFVNVVDELGKAHLEKHEQHVHWAKRAARSKSKYSTLSVYLSMVPVRLCDFYDELNYFLQRTDREQREVAGKWLELGTDEPGKFATTFSIS